MSIACNFSVKNFPTMFHAAGIVYNYLSCNGYMHLLQVYCHLLVLGRHVASEIKDVNTVILDNE